MEPKPPKTYRSKPVKNKLERGLVRIVDLALDTADNPQERVLVLEQRPERRVALVQLEGAPSPSPSTRTRET